MEEALEYAIDYCMKNQILTDFLKKNRAEVLRTVLFAYDQEEHIRMEKEESRERGREEGSARVNTLNMRLLSANRISDLQRASQDPEYQRQLFREFNV